jgi:AcrR family transcriptional regulator
MTTSPARTAPPAGERSYGGQAHGERIEARRRRFLDAGIELFGTLGYRAATVRGVTAAAGLSNRYFYESFASMEDLLMACYQDVTAGYRQQLVEALATTGDSIEQRVRIGVRRYLEQMRDPRFARITQVEVLGVSARVDALYVKSLRDFGALIVRAIAPSTPVRQAAEERSRAVLGVALAGAMSTAGAMWMRSHYRDDIEAVEQVAVDILLGTAHRLNRRDA